MRRSRGYAPLPVALPRPPVRARRSPSAPTSRTPARSGEGGYAWLSQHVGDMDDLATLEAFARLASGTSSGWSA